MWETNFWTGMLDNMARHRYNLLSLWSLHPFPSLVRVPEYPKVALADVKRKAGAMWNATGSGVGMYDPSWELTTLKKMTMDEKIAFWRWVMQYAKDRGIDCYVMTWNIFVLWHGVQRLRHHGFAHQRDHEGLLPKIRARDVQHLSASGGRRIDHR